MDIRGFHGGKDGLVYLKTTAIRKAEGKRRLLFGADGPTKVWVNRKEVAVAPNATNPAIADQYSANVNWRKGRNEIIFAVHSNKGRAWGIISRVE
jgi:hypothetical protein